MEILTPKDFLNTPYRVPNAVAQQPSGGFEVNDDFANYINEKVSEALLKLLGSSLYESFLEAIEALPADWIDAHAYAIDNEVLYNYHVWKSLVNNNVTIPKESVQWELIPDSESTPLLPIDEPELIPVLELYNGTTEWVGMKKMLVPYVYCFWLRDTYDDHTKNGVVRRAGENSIPIDPTLRIARAYNRFSTYTNSLYHYLHAGGLSYIPYDYYYDINHWYPYYCYRPTYGTFNFGHYSGHGKFPGGMNIFNI